jgi:hypothetical protein
LLVALNSAYEVPDELLTEDAFIEYLDVEDDDEEPQSNAEEDLEIKRE